MAKAVDCTMKPALATAQVADGIMDADAASGLGLDCAGARAPPSGLHRLALAADSGQHIGRLRSSDRMPWLASKAARRLS